MAGVYTMALDLRPLALDRSVFCRALDVIDDEHLDGRLRRLEPQTELFLQSREDLRLLVASRSDPARGADSE